MVLSVLRTACAVITLGVLYGANIFWLGFHCQPSLADEKPAEQSTPEATTPSGRQSDQNLTPRKHPFPNRTPAPSFAGGSDWLNASGAVELRDLRGKFVLLDFWTYCCINCMHILPELKKLERAYPNTIVVIGIHSAKFETEKDADNIRQAILRYDIEHPVINDPDHLIWRRYGIRSWPSLCVIDPQGNLIAGHSGEIDFRTLNNFFKRAIPYYKNRGLLDDTPVRFDLERDRTDQQALNFPGKVLADADSNRLYISDSGHNRIVVTDLEGKWIKNIGSGVVGSKNGPLHRATFNNPQGLALDTHKLYVADTQNHLIRVVDLKQEKVYTLAGTGKQNRMGWPGMDRVELSPGGLLKKLPTSWSSSPKQFPLASPWALLVHQKYLYIAMAGSHQIWRMPLKKHAELEVFAGNGREDITDGIRVPQSPPRINRQGFGPEYASFAQPSGLASDGNILYVADSEGSAVRAVPFNDGNVNTVVGQSNLPQGRALFSFGDKNGKAETVRLQHVLGIAEHDGAIYVADTYNNKIKKIDVKNREATTIAGEGTPGKQDLPAQFDEPAGLSYARGKLYIADTNNHAIRTIDLENNNQVTRLALQGLTPPQAPRSPSPSLPNVQRIQLAPMVLRPENKHLTLSVQLSLPEGWKLNDVNPIRYQIIVDSTGGPLDQNLVDDYVKQHGSQKSAEFDIELPLVSDSGSDNVKLSLTCYYCREGAEGLCKVGSILWSVPVQLSRTAEKSRVVLRHTLH